MSLPQLDGPTFITDGGMETTLIFHHGLDLPHFAAFTLLANKQGRDALSTYYDTYLDVAEEYDHPIVLDTALFLDLAKRAKMHGIQEWLSFYFKSPMHAPEVYPEHDLFIQLMKLKNTLRYLKGEELITHLGREYYD